MSLNQTLLEEETGVPGHDGIFRNFAGDCKNREKQRRRVRSAKPNEFQYNKKSEWKRACSVKNQNRRRKGSNWSNSWLQRAWESVRKRVRVLGFWEECECECEREGNGSERNERNHRKWFTESERGIFYYNWIRYWICTQDGPTQIPGPFSISGLNGKLGQTLYITLLS